MVYPFVNHVGVSWDKVRPRPNVAPLCAASAPTVVRSSAVHATHHKSNTMQAQAIRRTLNPNHARNTPSEKSRALERGVSRACAMLLALAFIAASAPPSRAGQYAYTYQVLDGQVGAGFFSLTVDPAASYSAGYYPSAGVVLPLSVDGGLAPYGPWISGELTIYSGVDGPPAVEIPWWQVYLFNQTPTPAPTGVSNYLPSHPAPWTGAEIANAAASAPQLSLISVVDVSRPVINQIIGPTGPISLGSGGAAASISVAFDAVGDPITVGIAWGDGQVQDAVVPAGIRTLTLSHIYVGAGVFPVGISVSDGSGRSASGQFDYVVVYDPKGTFATGGGWIPSPAGSFHPGDAAYGPVVGKAKFGFVAKYETRNGVATLKSEAEFELEAGDNFRLHFNGAQGRWFVGTATTAEYLGAGSVNGQPGFLIFISAQDGSPDLARFSIWNEVSGEVLYDNQPGALFSAPLDAMRTTLGGGNIKVQRK